MQRDPSSVFYSRAIERQIYMFFFLERANIFPACHFRSLLLYFIFFISFFCAKNSKKHETGKNLFMTWINVGWSFCWHKFHFSNFFSSLLFLYTCIRAGDAKNWMEKNEWRRQLWTIRKVMNWMLIERVSFLEQAGWIWVNLRPRLLGL